MFLDQKKIEDHGLEITSIVVKQLTDRQIELNLKKLAQQEEKSLRFNLRKNKKEMSKRNKNKFLQIFEFSIHDFQSIFFFNSSY